MKTNHGMGGVRVALDAVLLMIVLPMAGVIAAGKPTSRYLEFPPETRYVAHAQFSWPVFILMALGLAAVVLPFVVRVIRSRRNTPLAGPPRQRFPGWGWLGLGLTATAWVLAWTRFEWFGPLQKFTFLPLWLGYIVTVNALVWRRTGACMMTRAPGRFMALFGLSAAFWWFFEYLNRFVQNWYYVSVDGFSGVGYFVNATLSFSTVLPAVMGTYELLDAYPRAGAGLDRFVRLERVSGRIAGWIALVACSIGLALVGVFPDVLFPLLWISPLGVVSGLQAVRGHRTIFSPVREGNWRRLYLLAIAALICGFFWEMWNFYSQAKWIYEVSYVGRFKLFEMPALGFAGYLPFGLECAVIAGILGGDGTRALNEPDREKEEIVLPSRAIRAVRRGNALLCGAVALYFFLAPAVLVIRDIADPALRDTGIPRLAWRLHRDLAPQLEKWALSRMASGKAAQLDLYDVPATEWPVFSAVYYLWATEALQSAWQADPRSAEKAPAVQARAAIEAALAIVLDPVHHTWVRQHWGADYMHRENVFFRSLVIAAITSHENLLHTGRHLELLRDQVDTLAATLDKSPLGLLNDYPNECYPIDVLCAAAMIRRADAVLGTDHTAFIAREKRAFEGRMEDPYGLIPYFVDPVTGEQGQTSRGTGNSYALIYARELWPDKAEEWYARYETEFWQKRAWAEGFREFPRNRPGSEWTYDVDAGPVLAGYSPAACAFGVAAAKVNGRLDHAFKLGTQVAAACWPLPDGTLLGPRILSLLAGRDHAPYLGETCILYFFAQQTAQGVQVAPASGVGRAAWVGLTFFIGTGLLLLAVAVRAFRRVGLPDKPYPLAPLQFCAWAVVTCLGIGLILTGAPCHGAGVLLVAQVLPLRV